MSLYYFLVMTIGGLFHIAIFIPLLFEPDVEYKKWYWGEM